MKSRPAPFKSRLLTGITAFACLLTAAPSILAADSLEALREREAKVKEVASKAMNTTVGILSKNRAGAGSGVVIGEDGLVLTAAHVVQAAGDELEVVFPDGRRFPGISLGQNRSLDAAMVQIQADESTKFEVMEIGNSKKLELGQWCIAMGHPGGYDRLRTPPVRLGRVWSKDIPGMIDMLVTDCTLVGGDSGGPLFDLDGKVIGIHSSIGGGLEQNRHVPISVFKRDWERLKNNERWGSIGMMSSGIDDPDRPMLGIQMGPETDSGVPVLGVFPNSPADKAGVKPGDIVVALDKKSIKTPEELMNMVKTKKAGDKLEISLLRDGKKLSVTSDLTVAENLEFPDRFGLGNPHSPEKPPAPKPPKLDPPKREAPKPAQFGAMMWDTDENAEVIELIPGSAAEKAGIEVGDVIVEIDGAKTPNTEAMAKHISRKAAGDRIRVKLLRGDGKIDMEITLGAAK